VYSNSLACVWLGGKRCDRPGRRQTKARRVVELPEPAARNLDLFCRPSGRLALACGCGGTFELIGRAIAIPGVWPTAKRCQLWTPRKTIAIVAC